ncbi:hypothetical protein [Paenimyroides aestuarii]|uniref:Uncharacterized protein n=1 Tax=Paenimyroides aestuarii TaxID=2968490 RepID=A0ABY5NPH3_9FLAO|nr:hypothetical protein [Paenimyroides aestuarii]UUV20445.1 hypothetical protein NPX36_08695 [Paenimyroides aestuarii]
MLEEVKIKLEQYEILNDIHQFKLILDASKIFIDCLPNGVTNTSELNLGIELFRKLMSITMVTSLHQYEYNYDLQNDILYKKLAVFRLCIPESHKNLRGLTEMLVGMRENEMDDIIKKMR